MKPDKQLGQHWLNDQASLLEIVSFGEVTDQDTVLEVGPGLGSLTKPLLETGAKVVAVEYDKKLIDPLQKQFGDQQLQLINEDILQFDLFKLPSGYKVVANIPYYLTSSLIRKLLESPNQPALVTLLVQKEVAERITARPGKMSLLSVSAQLYSQVKPGSVIPAELFEPPPKVDSQIVQLRPHTEALFPVDIPKFFQLVKAGFGERRKKLANSLSGGLKIDKSTVNDLMKQCEFAENTRAQELSLQQWWQLYNKFYSNGQ